MAGAYSATKMALRSLAFTVAREIGNDVRRRRLLVRARASSTPRSCARTCCRRWRRSLGLSIEQATAIVAQNPGYDGLMPVDHCATALVHAIVHGSEHHGQVADPFEPLDRIGVIQMPHLDPDEAPARSTSRIRSRGCTSSSTSATSRTATRSSRTASRSGRASSTRRADAPTRLLLNILPAPIAERLKAGEHMIADHFAAVTVLFADIVDFTPISARS